MFVVHLSKCKGKFNKLYNRALSKVPDSVNCKIITRLASGKHALGHVPIINLAEYVYSRQCPSTAWSEIAR